MKIETLEKANRIAKKIEEFDEFIKKIGESSIIGARYRLGYEWVYTNIHLEEKALKEVFDIVKRERYRLEDELKRI